MQELETRIIHSISELNQLVNNLFNDAFPPIWVEGEISNFSSPSSGHWYFSLKDANAQVRCAMFQGKNRSISFKIENGMKVLARAKISLYEPRGEYQLIVDYLEEAGDGALRRAFELLKAKLEQEGLFSLERKKALPKYPKTIGVITSPTGAVIRDIIHVLNRRFPAIKLIVYPTAVQGSQAAQQIVQALQIANLRKECDVLILARGGGSLEDLYPFNQEEVARAIANSTLPIVSAVGHEVDFTIADFVADVRAPTPSAAAELVSPDCMEWLLTLAKIEAIFLRQIRGKIQQEQQTLNTLIKLLRHPGQKIQDQFQRIDELEQRLKLAVQNRLSNFKHQVITLVRALDAISPLATLGRGYAILSLPESKEIIRSCKQVSKGDKITARLAEGELNCLVE